MAHNTRDMNLPLGGWELDSGYEHELRMDISGASPRPHLANEMADTYRRRGYPVAVNDVREQVRFLRPWAREAASGGSV